MYHTGNFGPIEQAAQIMLDEQLDNPYSSPEMGVAEIAEFLLDLHEEDPGFLEFFLSSIGEKQSYGCLLALKKLPIERQIPFLPMFRRLPPYGISEYKEIIKDWPQEAKLNFLRLVNQEILNALFRMNRSEVLLEGMSEEEQEEILSRLNTLGRTAHLLKEMLWNTQKIYSRANIAYLDREISREVSRAAASRLLRFQSRFSQEAQIFLLNFVPENSGIE